MKSFTRFLVFALALHTAAAGASPVGSTLGSNLTAYNPNGNAGAINNNAWNNMTNPRGTNTTTATADFGNCNSVILRCAQPKCASGGCATMEIATPIVSGCVMSSDACKQYADDGLIEAIAAQLVAASTAKSNQAATEAANAAAQQSALQMQQMQAQMQQMQAEMAAQNAETVASLQAALEEQKQQTAQAIADANAAAASAQQAAAAPAANTAAIAGGTTTGATTSVMDGLTQAQNIAAQNGISADILAREQIAGQILSKIENAQQSMNSLKATMQTAFDYAGCDSKGDNCTGPKRVTIFKQKAMEFFEPYENVLDELYDALIMAQSVGVDITDIYMMLNGSCNVWGEYLCYGGMVQTVGIDYSSGSPSVRTVQSWALYDKNSCPNGKSVATNFSKGGVSCTIGAVIPPEDSPSCTLNRMITDNETVQRNYLFADNGDYDEHVRVGCASSALESSALFRNRKKQASIDIETLQRIIQQDAPSVYGSGVLGGAATNPKDNGLKYCAITSSSLQDLQKVVSLKKLPSRICVKDGSLAATFNSGGQISAASYDALGSSNSGYSIPNYTTTELCEGYAQCKFDGNKCIVPAGKEWNGEVCITK